MRNGYIIDARIAWWKVQTRSQAIVLTVTGELDASNTDRFHKSVRGITSAGDPFIIDLRDVSFIGVQCLRILLALDAECRATGTRWALVADSAVQSLLDIADADATLPVTTSLSAALRQIVAPKGTILRIASRQGVKSRSLNR